MHDDVEELVLVPYRAGNQAAPFPLTAEEWETLFVLSQKGGYTVTDDVPGLDRRSLGCFRSAISMAMERENVGEPMRSRIKDILAYCEGPGREGISRERRWRRAAPREANVPRPPEAKREPVAEPAAVEEFLLVPRCTEPGVRPFLLTAQEWKTLLWLSAKGGYSRTADEVDFDRIALTHLLPALRRAVDSEKKLAEPLRLRMKAALEYLAGPGRSGVTRQRKSKAATWARQEDAETRAKRDAFNEARLGRCIHRIRPDN